MVNTSTSQTVTPIPRNKALVAAKLPEAPPEANADTDDKVTLSDEKAVPKKRKRRVRKGFLKAASTGMAIYESVVSLPESIALGLDTANGASHEVKRTHSTRLSILSNTLAGAAVGSALGGPVGLVCGGVMGFLSGTMSNHLAAKSGVADQRVKNVSDKVSTSIGESKGAWGKIKGAVAGAFHGTKEAFQTRKTTATIQLAGALDGIEHVREAKEAGEFSSHVESTTSKKAQSRFGGLLQKSVGLVCGVSGVMINAPGGLIIGMLESVKDSKNYKPDQLTKSTMLLATNVGKFLPAAAVAAVLGGPVGIATSTAVGVATASLDSIIDGRFGVNRRIAGPVERAVNEAHGEENYQENLRAYYRAGKGAVVGLSVGVDQGWKTGRQGGIDIVSDLVDATDSVAATEADEKKDEAKAKP